MPQTSWQPLPDGSVSFDHPAGPLVLGGPDAAAEAARRDAQAGTVRPLDFYQGIARRESMATSPGALAQAGAGGAPGGDPNNGPPAAPAAASDAGGAPMPDRPLQWSPSDGARTFSAPPQEPSTEGPPVPPVVEPPDPGRGGAFGSGGVNTYESERKSQETEAGWNKRFSGGDAATSAAGQAGAPASVDPSKVVTAGAKSATGAGGGSGEKVFRDARMALDEATRFQQGSAEAGEASRTAADQRQAEVLRQQNEIDRTAQAAREERMVQLEQRSKQWEEAVSRNLAEADKMKIDPERWLSSRTPMQRVLLGIASFFGGMGGTTAVADMVNRRVDADIRAQIENRDGKIKQASATQALYKDYLATFKDHDEALMATAATVKMNVAKAALQQALEVGSPEQIAKANELQAKLLEQQSAQYAQLAQQRAAAAAKGAGGAAAAAKKQRTIMIGGVAYPVRANMPDAEYNKLTEEALKVDRVFRTVDQVANDKSEPPGFLDRAAATVGYKTAPIIKAEANADSVQSADSQLSGEGTSSETAVRTGREKYGGINRDAGLAEERKKARAAAQDLVRRISE